MSWSEMCTWNDDTPAIVPAGARISAGKLGSVARSLPNTARQLGEPVADELHAVARVAREPDHDAGRAFPLRRVGLASTVTVDHQLSQLRCASRSARRSDPVCTRTSCSSAARTPRTVATSNRPVGPTLYRHRARDPVLGGALAPLTPRAASSSPRRRAPQRGAHPPAVAGPGDDLGLDLDPRRGRARRRGRSAGAPRPTTTTSSPGVELLDPRRRVPAPRPAPTAPRPSSRVVTCSCASTLLRRQHPHLGRARARAPHDGEVRRDVGVDCDSTASTSARLPPRRRVKRGEAIGGSASER